LQLCPSTVWTENKQGIFENEPDQTFGTYVEVVEISPFSQVVLGF
jgi:hypothetical protein